MDGSGNEFQDWELLEDDIFTQVYPSRFSDSNSRCSDVTEADLVSGGIIRLDYFSLRNHEIYTETVVEPAVSEECLVDVENLTSSDTGSEERGCRGNISELTSESGDDLLDVDEFYKSHGKIDDALADITKGIQGFQEITSEADNLEILESYDVKLSSFACIPSGELVSTKDMNRPVDSEEFGEGETRGEPVDKFYSNSSANESAPMNSGDDRKEGETSNDHMDSVNNLSEDLGAEDGHSSLDVNVTIEEVKLEAKSGDGEVKKRVMWWKVPFQLLKYCFLRASPAWSFSVAAAFMGLMILGRRWYKMKRKSKSFQLKIAVDDKKVSQFASQAARLNEAFLVVRRVPVVRASLPGSDSWPAMNMR